MIERFPDSHALARAAAEHFIRLADEAITLRGRFAVALSGGETPKMLYQQLAGAEMAARVHWSRIYVFWGDERCVAPDDADSNYRLAYESLLRHIPIPPENIHRIHGELPPKRAAKEYARRLAEFFFLLDHEIPRFDLILLGLGTNGHTASLFPYTSALHAQSETVIAQFIEELHAWRITLTPPVLNHAANVIFLVSGSEKAEILRAVLHGPAQPDRYPAQLVQPTAGRLLWFGDEEAAASLEE